MVYTHSTLVMRTCETTPYNSTSLVVVWSPGEPLVVNFRRVLLGNVGSVIMLGDCIADLLH